MRRGFSWVSTSSDSENKSGRYFRNGGGFQTNSFFAISCACVGEKRSRLRMKVSVFWVLMAALAMAAVVVVRGDELLVMDFDDEEASVKASTVWTPVQRGPEGAVPKFLMSFAERAASYLHRKAFTSWGSPGLRLEQHIPDSHARYSQWLVPIRIMDADVIDLGDIKKYRITIDVVNPLYYYVGALDEFSNAIGSELTQRHFTEWFGQTTNANRDTLARIPASDRFDYVVASLMAIDPKKFPILYQAEGIPGSTIERWTVTLAYVAADESGKKTLKVLDSQFEEEFEISQVLKEHYETEITESSADLP